MMKWMIKNPFFNYAWLIIFYSRTARARRKKGWSGGHREEKESAHEFPSINSTWYNKSSGLLLILRDLHCQPLFDARRRLIWWWKLFYFIFCRWLELGWSSTAKGMEKRRGKGMKRMMMMENIMKKDHSDCLCHYDKMMMGGRQEKRVQELEFGVRRKTRVEKKNASFAFNLLLALDLSERRCHRRHVPFTRSVPDSLRVPPVVLCRAPSTPTSFSFAILDHFSHHHREIHKKARGLVENVSGGLWRI